MALDFTTALLDPRITFTRNLATATRVNASGFIEIANANIARFYYDPITLACKGLLIEELRQNICLQSVNLTNSPWNASAEVLLTPNSGISVDGTNNAFLITSLSGSSRFSQAFTVTENTTYTVSFYAKKVNDGDVFLFESAGNTLTNYSSLINTGTWTRVQKTVTTGAGVTTLTVQFTRNMTIGTSVLLCAPQLEAGAFSTSYIPTTSAAVTRNADVATITGTNFSDFWQASKGGAQVLATPSTVTNTRPLVQFDDGTANNIIALRGNTTNPELQIVDGGAPQAAIDAGTIATNTPYSLTGWWQLDFCAARQNNNARVVDNSATIPTVTQMRIGSDGTNYLNGTVATINYYDKFSDQIYNRRKNKAVFSVL